ncbi:hypothetical protein PISMIDRAFT_576690 [Pisolithus microcarpus 441]|uniref:Uncharacterized protein n=1 Tax=Pisolithus microcarpus 441 TaxID=765257 RepID=A0A0C9Z3D8_9AGAM|nr:hypothetical protein BKA83DRAFT_576690 [Pisolithus microcarpus]KIK20744.1 hypothetical protein PISMIDRAFT_576690 [Pisolithus microcarpus 441]
MARTKCEVQTLRFALGEGIPGILPGCYLSTTSISVTLVYGAFTIYSACYHTINPIANVLIPSANMSRNSLIAAGYTQVTSRVNGCRIHRKPTVST